MAERDTKPDSGGARYIAEQFVKSMKELMDERYGETKRLRDVVIPDLDRKVGALQTSLANITGRLAVIVIVVSILISGIVTLIVRALQK